MFHFHRTVHEAGERNPIEQTRHGTEPERVERTTQGILDRAAYFASTGGTSTLPLAATLTVNGADLVSVNWLGSGSTNASPGDIPTNFAFAAI